MGFRPTEHSVAERFNRSELGNRLPFGSPAEKRKGAALQPRPLFV
jgi:hypothetical protein